MDILWPVEGDKAFKEGPMACCIATQRDGPHELSLMAAGYKTASDLLVQHLEQNRRDDSLVYPIIFGYRQYLELSIKALIIIVNRSDYVDKSYERIHVLRTLWNLIRSRLWDSLEDDHRLTFQTVENVVKEFEGIDPGSFTFRYPSDTEQFNIDLVNMRNVMGRVASFLDSLRDIWQAGVDAMPDTGDLRSHVTHPHVDQPPKSLGERYAWPV